MNEEKNGELIGTVRAVLYRHATGTLTLEIVPDKEEDALTETQRYVLSAFDRAISAGGVFTTDAEAYAFIEENDLYDGPRKLSATTFVKRLGEARGKSGRSLRTKVAGRPHGGSIVKATDI